MAKLHLISRPKQNVLYGNARMQTMEYYDNLPALAREDEAGQDTYRCDTASMYTQNRIFWISHHANPIGVANDGSKMLIKRTLVSAANGSR